MDFDIETLDVHHQRWGYVTSQRDPKRVSPAKIVEDLVLLKTTDPPRKGMFLDPTNMTNKHDLPVVG
jgi:hypothetical protein